MNVPLRSLPRLFVLCLCLVLIIPLITPAASAASTDADMIHILLIGQDSRNTEDPARADSIILCSFSPGEKQITVTSFLRDLYVSIPGHQNNRLNAAFAFGGMELVRQTLEENFALTIDGCFEADFSQFPRIIDTLGGVSIELRQDEAEAINHAVSAMLTEGTCLLTGEQALAYSRIRNLDSDGDFSRTERQRKLVTSLLHSYRNVSLLTVLSAVADLLPMISTDLSKKQILRLAARLFPLLDSPRIRTLRIPADGTFAYKKIRGMEVLTGDMETLRQTLQNALFSEAENRP